MKNSQILWIALLCMTLLPQVSRAGDQRDKIAVLALRKDVELPDGTLRTLNELLLSEFQHQGKLEVLSPSDIKAMLDLEQTKQQFAACNDDSCLAEIGGALGVQLMAAASLGAVGEQYVINIKIVDVSQARVLSRTSEIIPRDDSMLIAGLKRGVGKVLAAVVGPVLKKNSLASDDSSMAHKGSSVWKWLPWTTLALTVVAAGSGGVFGGLALSDAESARAKEEGTPEYDDAKTAAESKALYADILFGVAAASAVTTLVLFLVKPDSPKTSTQVEIEPSASIVQGGATAGVLVRF